MGRNQGTWEEVRGNVWEDVREHGREYVKEHVLEVVREHEKMLGNISRDVGKM